MAVQHRALWTWFIILIFLILLVLRLDEQTGWPWFIVFIPMWLYDSILFLYLIFNMIIHCKNGHDATPMRVSDLLVRKIWYICGVLMKLAFQIMLCLKLESTEGDDFDIPTYYLMLPLWIWLPVTIIDMLVILCTRKYQDYHTFQSYRGRNHSDY